MGGMLFDILRVAAATVVAGVVGYLRLQGGPYTTHEMIGWVALTFFGTLWLTGAFNSSRDKGASL